MFGQHKDDKKKIEKAMEAARLPSGKVKNWGAGVSGLHFTKALKNWLDRPCLRYISRVKRKYA